MVDKTEEILYYVKHIVNGMDRKELIIARVPRQYLKNSYFHVMVQGINKEKIFNTNKNIEKYLSYVKEINQQYDILIISYCVMPNHTHFLIKANNIKELSNFMQKLNTKYAIYYNKVNNRVGYVYRDRYKLQVIASIEHFYRCVEYIHNNPVKAGICNSQNDYKYSSFGSIYNFDKTQLYKRIDEILLESNLDKSTDVIEKFLEDEEDENNSVIIDKILKDNSIDKYELVSKENINKLKEVVYILSNEYKISYREMGKYLGVSREKLRKLNTRDKF